MLLFTKILVLLWLVNFAPPLLAHLFGERWNMPLDRNVLWKDGNPLLGSHKTIRGLLGGILMGLAVGLVLGFPWWAGMASGMLSMLGDLISSFIKRRQGLPSGGIVPGLDQGFEGLLPFLVLGPYYALAFWQIVVLLATFSAGAYLGSVFFKNILLAKPYEAYPRPVDLRVRLREFRACEITSNPLHHLLNFEDAFYYHCVMKTTFRILGIYERGKHNALQIRQAHVTLYLPDLPPAFEDYTILFLSDLHLDGLEGLTDALIDLVRELPVDLCLVGGDLRMETHGPFTRAISEFSRILPEIRAKDGIYGVLGNHDCIEIVKPLEERGVNFLVNDSKAIERHGSRIWLVGVDDPHYYQCHDLEQAFKNVPPEDFTIFLAHSNEIYREASQYYPQLYLCGHCHAGQIQLPAIGPIFTHSRAPRRLCRGVWHYGRMTGYTSCGVGVSGIPVRFASQGEVDCITLKRSIDR